MYETVEDYKKTKFGLIPNDWIIKKGEGLSTKITKGASPKWQGFDYQDNGILFVTSENVREGVLDVTQPKFLPIEFGEKQKNSKLKKGDILINIVGASIGRSCEYDIDVEANINQAVCLFRAKSEADKSFIKYYLQSNSVKKRLLGTQTESARPNLSLTDIREFEFVLPTNDKEKLKIASILSTWDKAIELKEKLIEQKKEQKKGLMQKLLTGEVRLPGFEGKWRQVRLGKLTKLQGGYAFKSTEFVKQGIPIIRISNIAPEITDTNQDFVYYDEVEISDSFKVNFGDILIAMSGATTGKVGLYKNRELAYLNQRVGKFVNLDESKLDYSFLYHLVMSSTFKLQLKEELATGAQPNISSKQIENFKFNIPPLDEQKKISRTLNQIDRSIILQEKEIALLKHQKQGLMQLLLTGKVRVKL